MNAIETRELTHRFSATDTILHDVSLTVPTGCIYGFLGPNGAGKTTTLRLVLGLLRRQHGRIELLGRPLEAHRVELLKRVGSSIESPSIYAHLSARENLAIWQTVYDCPPSRVPEVLRLVGLEHTGAKRAGQFSLGMKQRLSIAIALLHEPELLVLDEPTNGLDPQGILDIRDLLLTLNRERNTTILISSHLLVEVERLITHVGVIHRGRMKFQGTLSALLEASQVGNVTLIDTDDNARAQALLIAEGHEIRLEEGKLTLPALHPAELGRLNTRLINQGIGVHELTTRKKDLESLFFDLIQD
jgi:lantibiotic transport system ATP-binding protein